VNKKLRVGVIFGGKSGEHEVSIHSAQSVMHALKPERYDVVPIGITKTGVWGFGVDAFRLLGTAVPERFLNLQNPAGNSDITNETQSIAPYQREKDIIPHNLQGSVDVVIPVLHGSYGEDGTVQGLLELLDVPYVGAGVLASALGMDKVMMKRMFREAGFPQCNFLSFLRWEWEKEADTVLDKIEGEIGYPCFVKPANLGSSVGISKAKNREQLVSAIELAVQYDRKIIVEEGLNVRELEVAVLGNEDPIASVVGEIIPSNEFYDYHAKYIGGESELIIPAPVPPEIHDQIRQYAIQAFKSIDCSGLARVDFFLEKETNRILLNEINTMPGFTAYSMYPKLWEATGIPYSELLDRLITLALQRYEEKKRNRVDFTLE
jgi:D-alanine-D-alanine ligase